MKTSFISIIFAFLIHFSLSQGLAPVGDHPIHATPPTGFFDQKRLPLSAIDNWQRGVSAMAEGKNEDAMVFFEKAAAEGNADAAFEIGRYAESSVFFKQDPLLAAQWYKFASANGHTLAAHHLAIMTFQDKTPEPKDSWLLIETTAAFNGSSDAAMVLMTAYGNGTGVERNDTLQRAWRDRFDYMKLLALNAINTEDVKHKMALMFDDIVAKVENIFIILDTSLYKYRTPAHTIRYIEVTKFNGRLNLVGQIDLGQPFEIECKVTPDPVFMPWMFRINNVILLGKAFLTFNRMSWGQHAVFTQMEPQVKAYLGQDYTVGVHDLGQ